MHDRSLTGVFLSPSEQEGVPSYVLSTGPLTPLAFPSSYGAQSLADLYAVDQGATGPAAEGVAGTTLVVQATEIFATSVARYRAPTDAQGRLLVFRPPDDAEMLQQSYFDLWRYDVGRGSGEVLAQAYLATTWLDGVPSLSLSPGRTQLFVRGDGDGSLIGPTGQQVLAQVNAWAFIGEDFYFAGSVSAPGDPAESGSSIIRIRPDAAPEVLLSSTGQLSFVTIVGDFTPQLLLSLSTDQGMAPFALFDTVRLTSTSLPAEKGSATLVAASDDGRYLVFGAALPAVDKTQPAAYRLFVYDWRAGAYANLDLGVIGKPLQGIAEWRPGTDELWILTLPSGFATWSPSTGSETFARAPASFATPDGAWTWFSRDGHYWFARSRDSTSTRAAISVGDADDPAGAIVRLNPTGTDVSSVWQLGDGRLLVEAWAGNQLRNDIYLFDPALGTERALGSAGHLVAVGRDRVLALLDWQLARSSGRLVLIELSTGASTTLAEDVYAVDVDRGWSANAPAADPLAPGTSVAYLSRNRMESRDDGLWLAELP